jgi:hypothetical protein
MEAGMMMVRAGHLGGWVSQRKVLAWGWFCSVRCKCMRARLSEPVICRSGAERDAMRTGRRAASAHSSAPHMASAAARATAVTAAAGTASSSAGRGDVR